jgi:hypothetical protein
MPGTLSNSEAITVEQHKLLISTCTQMFNDLKILDHSGHVFIRVPGTDRVMIQGLTCQSGAINPGGDIYADPRWRGARWPGRDNTGQ